MTFEKIRLRKQLEYHSLLWVDSARNGYDGNRPKADSIFMTTNRKMNRLLIFTLVFITGISMAATEAKPLEVLDVGSYSQFATRPNPHHNKIVFVPSLAAILLAAERKAGRPLLEAEVKALRDHAAVTVMPPDESTSSPSIRTYDDIDPNNVWKEWVKLRARL